jgi:hypothetical protein
MPKLVSTARALVCGEGELSDGWTLMDGLPTVRDGAVLGLCCKVWDRC